MTSRSSIPQFIRGVPYTQSKKRGRVDGCLEWTVAVKEQTPDLPRVTVACRLTVTFYLPPDKYPTDLPHGIDLDNLLKRFFDALQETVFEHAVGRDSCVTEFEARKVKVLLASDAGAELEIRPLGE